MIYVISALAVVISIIYFGNSKDESKRLSRQERIKQSTLDLGAGRAVGEVMVEKQANEIAGLRNNQGDMERMVKSLQEEVKKLSGMQSQRPIAQVDIPKADDFLKNIQQSIKNGEVVPSGTLPYAESPEQIKVPEKNATTKEQAGEATPAQAAPTQDNTAVAKEPVKMPEIPRSLGVLKPVESESPASAEAEKEADAGVYSFYQPAGTFFTLRLLTGVVAPAGAKAKNNPHPMAFRVTDLSWLPNDVRQNTMGCVILSEGFGDLSSERVNGRGLTMSCVDRDGQSVLDQKIQGYVVDQDGKAGLRGTVVTKQGALLANALRASFLEAIGGGFTHSAQSIITTGSGTVTSTGEGFTKGLQAGLGQGFANAASKLSDFYMDMVDQMYPVIEVGATIPATFVITKGDEFKFDKKLFNNAEHENDVL